MHNTVILQLEIQEIKSAIHRPELLESHEY